MVPPALAAPPVGEEVYQILPSPPLPPPPPVLHPLMLTPAAIPATLDVRQQPEPKRRRMSPLLGPVRSPSRGVELLEEPPDIFDWWLPGMPEIDEPRRRALEELKKYIDDWRAADQDAFWHRKSGKPVLSVVICRSQSGELVTFRGMNTEVSLPAGSLCAERAAIAQAASQFQQAADILAIATADPQDKLNPLWPCEVCQSWLSKLRPQSPSIAVLAVSTSACGAFAVRVNGEVRLPPQLVSQPSPRLGPSERMAWPELVELMEGTAEWPWEARELVYVDGAWSFLHSGHQSILRIARSRGTHLLVGVHSDEVLKREISGPVREGCETRLGRIMQHRHVSSVLKDAPWVLTHDMIMSLGIRRVITGSVCKVQDVRCRSGESFEDPYRAARDLGILEVVPSVDETTEWKVHEMSVALSRL
mmetsp:Transcript_163216/g.523527  ORF Transcript_163216/g.523527 Transcript_163216/m.523527 type:complete len:419 (-) Transcript_163216:101-1357(-)